MHATRPCRQRNRLTALEQDAERLASEISAASAELASLGSERGQASLKFESVTEQLQRLESELVTLRAETETAAQ